MHDRARTAKANSSVAFAILSLALLGAGCGEADSPTEPAPDASDLRGAPIDGSQEIAEAPSADEEVEGGASPAVADPASPDPAVEPAEPDREAILAEAEQRARDALTEGGGAAAARSGIDDPEVRAAAVESALEQMHEFGGESLDAPDDVDGYHALSFPRLGGFSFEENPPEDAPPGSRRGPLSEPDQSQVPDDIRDLDGEKIAISGYMIPQNFRRGGTSAFSLVPVVPSCFFCVTPAPMDWIEVTTVDDEYVPYTGDDPITVTGTFEVGAVYQGRELHSLYRLKADNVKPLEQ